jgi:hypothetical protein
MTIDDINYIMRDLIVFHVLHVVMTRPYDDN